VLVGPRTGASERIVLDHCAGTRPGCVWWGECLLLFVLKNLALGGSGRDSLLAGSGYGSFAVVRYIGFMDGDLTMGSMPG